MRENDGDIEINFVELLRCYRAKLALIIAMSLIGALAGGLVTYYLVTPKYTASAKLYMVSASSDSIVNLADLNLGTSLSSDYRELLKIRPIFGQVIEEQGLGYTYEELLDMVTITTISDTRILKISVESAQPSEAMAVANALAQKAVTNLPRLMETAEPNIAERAILPDRPSSPNLTLNALATALAAAALVLIMLTVRYVTDDTLNSAEEVEKALGILPLAVIPEGSLDPAVRRKRRKRNGQ